MSLPALEAAVRTGDTPTAERQRLVRRPPHVLITTPESLHLLLTSRARETLRGVTHCIVDEIHALCPNKRGVFLALLLERLQALQPNGLRPHRPVGDAAAARGSRPLPRRQRAGCRRQLAAAARRPSSMPGCARTSTCASSVPSSSSGRCRRSPIWPSIYRLLGDEIREHRSTIVFANNRRAVERITAFLNEDGGDRPRPSRQRRPGSAAADRGGA